MSTEQNLKEAFAGESQANRKYTAFAQKADTEGYPGVAKLFRAAAHAETIHALSQFKVLNAIGSTAENLKAAVEGETFEFEKMYPGFIDEAQKENNAAAVRVFKFASGAEAVHAKLYAQALDNPTKDINYYVCPICGYIEAGSAPGKCPICGASGEKFINVG